MFEIHVMRFGRSRVAAKKEATQRPSSPSKIVKDDCRLASFIFPLLVSPLSLSVEAQVE
jgi:hypothetical protein